MTLSVLNKMIGFIVTAKPDEAKEFYVGKLGFTFLKDDGFALVLSAAGTMIRVAKLQQFTPPQYTVLGWEVPDVAAAVQELASKGVEFERYEFLHPDSDGICTFPNGDKAAWFKDPDGNTLSISQHV
jgi:catechol 2,3-dioxygenase-like lactoylglutathione lyase family enzyme